MKIKKRDTVIIISGKDKGKTGKVARTLPVLNRIVIEGANLRKKRVKPKRQGEKGQTILVPFPIDVSNSKIICSKCGKPTRVGYKIEGGKKFRVCKKCGGEL